MNRKLSQEQVREIQSRCARGELQKEVAKAFGVSAATVSLWVRKVDTSPKTRHRKISLDDVRVILGRLAQGEKPGHIALDYDVTRQAISDIQRGKTWGRVARPKAVRKRVWEE